MWRRDASGKTRLEHIGAAYGGNLSFRITALCAASAGGLTNPAELEVVERELTGLVNQHRVSSNGSLDNDTNVAEMMGEFLTAAVMHSHRPNEELLKFAAEQIPQMLGANWSSSAPKCRAIYYTTMALQIMGYKLPTEAATVAAIVAKTRSAEPVSVLEAPVKRVLSELQREGVLTYQHNFKYPPLSLDFRVILKSQSGTEKVIALEIDGFPHHSIFQIDRQEFSADITPLRDTLRNKLIRDLAGWPLVRIPGYMLDVSDPKQMRSLLIAELYKAIDEVPPANV
jgi:hypothetical protein